MNITITARRTTMVTMVIPTNPITVGTPTPPRTAA
jgi:hypothetical protein